MIVKRQISHAEDSPIMGIYYTLKEGAVPLPTSSVWAHTPSSFQTYMAEGAGRTLRLTNLINTASAK